MFSVQVFTEFNQDVLNFDDSATVTVTCNYTLVINGIALNVSLYHNSSKVLQQRKEINCSSETPAVVTFRGLEENTYYTYNIERNSANGINCLLFSNSFKERCKFVIVISSTRIMITNKSIS